MKDLIFEDKSTNLIYDINKNINIDTYKKIEIKDELNKYFTNIPKCTYPKYNIIYIDENNIKIEMALSGFEKNDLKVIFNDNQLTIIGNNMIDTNINKKDSIFLIKFISTRDFAIYFYLKPNVNIYSVNFINGLLIIQLHLQENKSNINYIPIL